MVTIICNCLQLYGHNYCLSQLSQLIRTATIGHHLHDMSIELLNRIFTIGKNCHNWLKFSQLVKIFTIGQNCQNWSRLSQLSHLVTIVTTDPDKFDHI